jgi:hypothetical protein
LLVIFAQQLYANPLKSPRRLINNQTVDLSPLFKWWTNHTSVRPLTGWVHITGPIVGTNSWGWIVTAKAEGPNHFKAARDSADAPPKDSGKILLQHPPLQDLAEFQKLKAELDTLNQNRKQLLDQETQAKNQSEVIAKERKSVGRNSAEARELSQENKQLNLASQQAGSAIKQLDVRIRPLKEKLATYPSSDHYLVDCFALDTGQETQSLPVYDHGSVFQ